MKSSALLFFSLAVLAVSCLILYKVWRIHLKIFSFEAQIKALAHDTSNVRDLKIELNNVYHQIQAHEDLISIIKLRHPLPPLRGWAASPDFLLQIAKHCLKARPKLIVECSSGASTIVLARCCELNQSGEVFSLEHDPKYAEKTREMLTEQGLEKWAKVIDAPLVQQTELGGQPWYSLAALPIAAGSCELLVIDGPPSDTAPQARQPALPRLSAFLAQSCTVFLDDASRPDEKQAVSSWLKQDPNFYLSQLDCEKGCAKLSRSSVA